MRVCHAKFQPVVWPGYGQNTESVGQLWCGFLKYYVEEFDFESKVICIRRDEPLTKFEKSWGRYTMAIEGSIVLYTLR